jgi:hypothetical protein
MQQRIVTILAAALNTGCFIFNGNIDPCAEGSPLQQDPKVAADCQQCSMSPCPDEGGETGEDSPGVQLSVAASDHRYAFDGVLSQNVKAVMDTAGGLLEIERGYDGCNANDVRDYSCNLGWDGHQAIVAMIGTQNDCLACEGEGGIDYIPFNTTSAWPACPSGHGAALMGAWVHDGQPTCTPNAPSPVTSCPKGHIQVWEQADPWTHFPSNNWTCKCPDGDDDQCQAGAVCEAGWTGGGGGLFGPQPKPTICTWDLGEGDANGVAPEGPSVYGLSAWEEGIVVTDRPRGEVGVRITPSFLLSLVPAAWNDDQRFDVATGELTYCGPDALCDWLGLADGDRLRMPRTDGLELLTGHELALVVEHADSTTTTFAVSIDFDGDLSD